MRCSHCGKCCKETEMLLSRADIARLENAGHNSTRFARQDRQGYSRLRNRGGHCVFHDTKKNRCRVYGKRPLGCRVYPVIFSEEDGIVVDSICPRRETVTSAELKQKGKTVVRLLRQIDREAEKLCLLHKTVKQS
jgi:Fe-S-cluster containining protein